MSTPAPATTEWVPLWDLQGGVALEYRGAWVAGSYRDGDIVMDGGVAYLCVRQTTARPTPWVPPPGIADGAWRVVGAAGQPAFENGYSTWDPTRVPRFRKLSSGLVLLAGILRTPSPVSTAAAFTLPVGYRPGPGDDHSVITQAAVGPQVLNVFSTGGVSISVPATGPAQAVNSWVYIDVMRFYPGA